MREETVIRSWQSVSVVRIAPMTPVVPSKEALPQGKSGRFLGQAGGLTPLGVFFAT
jgi:hypothetical protein